MEDMKDELKKLLNTTAFIELHCCDRDVFSFSINGKCITISAVGGTGYNEGLGWLEYTIEEDT